MSLIICDIGDAIVLKGTLTDDLDQPVVGASVTARVLPPSGTTEQDLGACTDDGNGVYSVMFAPTESGSWSVRMESAAPQEAAVEGSVYVRTTRFS